MGVSRRRFIQLGGMSLLLAGCAPGRLPSHLGPARVALADTSFDGSEDAMLIHVFLRGGADGLHLLPPTGDRGYARLRGPLALSETRPFAREFSLHPELSALAPLVERNQLAAVPAAGSPALTRSHFEAQDIMELGGSQRRPGQGGWLTRAMRSEGEAAQFASLALAARQPLSLRGSGAFAIRDSARFGLPNVSARAHAEIESLYRAGDGALCDAGANALSSLAEYERKLGRPRRGARPANADLASHAEQLLALDRAGLGVKVACLESGGWDTHAGQGAEKGKLAERIRDLGAGVATLAAGLGERRDWLLVVLTEFGRTVEANGSRGTDHGHGSVMLVAGPRVRGGVYGDWQGLSRRTLHEGRDLPVLTDWRSVLHEVVSAHLGKAPPGDTFPEFSPESLGIVA
jgi:uncharacterized protein (DUF1501 family)